MERRQERGEAIRGHRDKGNDLASTTLLIRVQCIALAQATKVPPGTDPSNSARVKL
jgi:hypothetical protein